MFHQIALFLSQSCQFPISPGRWWNSQIQGQLNTDIRVDALYREANGFEKWPIEFLPTTLYIYIYMVAHPTARRVL